MIFDHLENMVVMGWKIMKISFCQSKIEVKHENFYVFFTTEKTTFWNLKYNYRIYEMNDIIV